MKKKQYWSLGFKNKKGFIFTMDVAVALIIVFSLLFTASIFVVKTNKDQYSNLQLARLSSDFMRLLEYKGYFENPNENLITEYLDTNLPSSYKMHIEGSPECSFSAGDEVPTNKLVVGGKEFYFINGNYCSVRYQIWLE